MYIYFPNKFGFTIYFLVVTFLGGHYIPIYIYTYISHGPEKKLEKWTA